MDPSTGLKRKLPTVNKKINVKFNLSETLYLTFGFLKPTLEFEIRLIQKDRLESFNFTVAEWNALLEKLGPLTGWTSGREETNFAVTIEESADRVIKVVSYHDTLRFDCHGSNTYDITLNSLEAYELNRISKAVSAHLLRLSNHKDVINEMKETFEFFLLKTYLIMFNPTSNQCFTQDKHVKFETVYTYLISYVSPFDVITKFEERLKIKGLENDLHTYNLYTLVSGQINLLKMFLHFEQDDDEVFH